MNDSGGPGGDTGRACAENNLNFSLMRFLSIVRDVYDSALR